MKLISVFFILLIGTHSHASFFQTTCSSADASTQQSSGHRQTRTVISRVVDGKIVSTKYSGQNLRKLNVEPTTTVEIRNDNQTTCEEGRQVGITQAEIVYYQKFEITKTDGSEFEASTVGVSEDKKTVTAEMLCKTEMNAQVLCAGREP